jgi:hypothetical protein
VQQRKTYELHFTTGNVGDIHVVGRRAKLFKLLAGEDVDSNEMDLGVTVLASLGAGASLDHNEAVLAKSRTLHRVGGGSASIGAVKGVLML